METLRGGGGGGDPPKIYEDLDQKNEISDFYIIWKSIFFIYRIAKISCWKNTQKAVK